MLENISLVFVAERVSIVLNNPAGMLVMPVLENVETNITLVFVADDVSIPLNNPDGIDVIWVLENV